MIIKCELKLFTCAVMWEKAGKWFSTLSGINSVLQWQIVAIAEGNKKLECTDSDGNFCKY